MEILPEGSEHASWLPEPGNHEGQTNVEKGMAEFKLLSKEGVNYVEVSLNNETVRTEAGALRYMQGQIEMESKAPSLGGIFKAAITGESIFRPTYRGTGTLVLEPTLRSFFVLDMNNDRLILDQGAYWCSEASIEIGAQRNQMVTGLVGGEGLFQTTAAGTGKVIIQVPGPVEIVDLVNDKLVVDGTFAVARSASLNYQVQKATKSLFGSMTSGEGFVNVFSGTGRVWLAPVPNLYVMLQQMMASMVPTSSSS